VNAAAQSQDKISKWSVGYKNISKLLYKDCHGCNHRSTSCPAMRS